MSKIFTEGMPHDLVAPMYRNGYSIQPAAVDPDFSTDLFGELKANGQYRVEGAERGEGPGVWHNEWILRSIGHMPLLKEYLYTLNTAICDVTGDDRQHLTYLTVRACPVGEMSTQIHPNDDIAGPWLVALTVAGSGSFNIYPDRTLRKNREIAHEIPLRGDDGDPVPLATSPMTVGDAWGIYSGQWSAPHAGGMNTSPDPKVLVLLYGWNMRNLYPTGTQALHQG